MLDRVARENMRAAAAVEIVVEADDDLGTIWGWPGGLRLAVDNLVRNAITHGAGDPDRAGGAPSSDHAMTIVVDDNGRGLPAEEHHTCSAGSRAAAPLRRAVRGWAWRWWRSRRRCTAGSIELSDGPLGGLRATLTVSTSPEPPADSD